MKQDIVQYANSKVDSSDPETKKLCKLIIKNINNYKCYYCLDTGKTWRERDNMLIASWDGRGSYDIRKCNKCSNDNWIECSRSKELYSAGGVKIFRTNKVSISDIIGELKKLYKNKILEDNPEWNLFKKDTFSQKTKSTDININIKDLANIVKSSLQIYAGNVVELISQVEDMTINLSKQLTDEKESKEIIKRYITKVKNEATNEDEIREYYLLFKMDKLNKERNYIASLYKSQKLIYHVSYLILSPKNKPAQNKCNEIMNDNIENKLESFSF